MPSTIPICRFSSTDIAAMSRPAVVHGFSSGGQAERHHAGNMLALARFDPGQLVKLGDFAGNVYWRDLEESKREMRFTPDFPARTARQKASLPIPFGLTAPIPVITTRGTMS